MTFNKAELSTKESLGDTSEWSEIPQMYPVHGAAVAFFKGKLWVFGGSTGDDSYTHTITDKARAGLTLPTRGEMFMFPGPSVQSPRAAMVCGSLGA